jgi:hypothetical protein
MKLYKYTYSSCCHANEDETFDKFSTPIIKLHCIDYDVISETPHFWNIGGKRVSKKAKNPYASPTPEEAFKVFTRKKLNQLEILEYQVKTIKTVLLKITHKIDQDNEARNKI